jgi:hypothetical protein
MAFDAANRRTVLFGGWSTGYHGDTWVYDATGWTEYHTFTYPEPRMHPAMAYDSANGTVVLFGGLSGQGLLNDTWTLHGASWIEIDSTDLPRPRYSHAMAYNPATQRVVLFGGIERVGDDERVLFDTWEFDGQQWVETTDDATPPPARCKHAMAYDASRERVAVFAGWEITPLLRDMWDYGEGTWKEIVPVIAPSARHSHTMAYDTWRRVIVLFGGIPLSGETWEYSMRSIYPDELCNNGADDDSDALEDCDDPDCKHHPYCWLIE